MANESADTLHLSREKSKKYLGILEQNVTTLRYYEQIFDKRGLLDLPKIFFSREFDLDTEKKWCCQLSEEIRKLLTKKSFKFFMLCHFEGSKIAISPPATINSRSFGNGDIHDTSTKVIISRGSQIFKNCL